MKENDNNVNLNKVKRPNCVKNVNPINKRPNMCIRNNSSLFSKVRILKK